MVFKNEALIFFYDDSPVGYFEEPEYPTKEGAYRYTAFRGYGHYEMQMRLNEAGNARCYYDFNKERVSFTVEKSNHGILRLSSFEIKALL